eukprot:TRINITY_DN1549_c4_g1_i1.p1 TRINITY_DN1549_c4_g1~~TRINITY_DN1549_c4_g1_i1.p1  ORF type:complete len:200 (+),score=30.58 TRINITY_DN1549_c4_g1_i1:70-600(+)
MAENKEDSTIEWSAWSNGDNNEDEMETKTVQAPLVKGGVEAKWITPAKAKDLENFNIEVITLKVSENYNFRTLENSKMSKEEQAMEKFRQKHGLTSYMLLSPPVVPTTSNERTCYYIPMGSSASLRIIHETEEDGVLEVVCPNHSVVTVAHSHILNLTGSCYQLIGDEEQEESQCA